MNNPDITKSPNAQIAHKAINNVIGIYISLFYHLHIICQ